MQLWRKATFAIWTSDVRLAKKLYLIFFFFGTRMFATHIVSFALYCLLIPICATAPEVVIPFWSLVYIPLLVTISTCAFTTRGWTAAVPYVLYENAMSIVKTTAMLAGLLEWSNAHEWVVTTKLGRWVANKVDKVSKGNSPRRWRQSPKKTYGKECAMGSSSSSAPRTARGRTTRGSTPCFCARRGACSSPSVSTAWTATEGPATGDGEK